MPWRRRRALLDELQAWVRRARRRRGLHLCAVNLRILIGFAFVPAGLKKLLGQPFTDPDKVGVFHEFLHAFHATGGFYQFVGLVQLTAATLLMTQRFALLGAALLLPVLATINALCWSSAGVPTIIVVNLMTLGTVGLLLWELPRWRAVLAAEHRAVEVHIEAETPPLDSALWERCGLAILVLYFGAGALQGGVYRPRGVELDNPAFYLLPLIATVPVVTWLIDRARYRRRATRG